MAGSSWFLVCTIFDLYWGDHSQETQEKDCKRGKLPPSYVLVSRFSQAVRYICAMALIDTFKDIKHAWPNPSSTLILKERRKQSCPGKVTPHRDPASQMLPRYLPNG